jgi:hypothetical protein
VPDVWVVIVAARKVCVAVRTSGFLAAGAYLNVLTVRRTATRFFHSCVDLTFCFSTQARGLK